MQIEIESSWRALLGEEFEKEYFKNILKFLDGEDRDGKTIYPKRENIFAAFNTTALNSVKVVILGQDPYHGEGQAHGLSFSVQDGVKVPPSLRNIFKEIENEGLPSPVRRGVGGEVSGNLKHWAQQGVLLLNSVLTVEKKSPASHAKIGWAKFTDSVLEKISESQDGIIFVLWGAFAQNKKALIDRDKHFILESAHPSPFSAHRGFLGNGHFREINKILNEQGKEEINW